MLQASSYNKYIIILPIMSPIHKSQEVHNVCKALRDSILHGELYSVDEQISFGIPISEGICRYVESPLLRLNNSRSK